MKSKLKILVALLTGVAFIYSACKKNNSNPSGPALAPNQVASQVALNVTSSLFGGLGAFDVSGGLDAPGSFALHTKGKVLQDLTNPTCGLSVDTTVTFTDAVNGGSATIAGTIKFSFACTNNIVSSYTTDDNISIKLTSPSLDLNYKVGEDFTLTALDPSNSNSNLSLTGSLTSSGSYNILTGTKGSGTKVFNYNLTSLIIDPNTADLVSGSATFTTSGTGPQGVWNYSGTIVFKGNFMATVTINGKVYTVNLQTGTVS